MRFSLLMVSAFSMVAAYAGQSLLESAPADPCDANPEIHACAVFLQPEWQRRSVHAGRSAPVTTPAVSETEALAATDESAEVVRTTTQHSDGV